MKPYLTRLAERAAPPREIAPIISAPVADPFASTEAEASSADAFSAKSNPHRETRGDPETLRPPTMREQPAAPTRSPEMAVAPPSKPSLPTPLEKIPTLTPPATPVPKDRGEKSALAEKRTTPELPDRVERSLDRGEERIRPIMLPASRDALSGIPHLPERDEGEEGTVKTDPEAKKPATSFPLESDLLRLADRFMEGLQRGIPVPPKHDELERNEPLPLLPPRQAELHAQSTRAAAADSVPSPSVHIGSLRVEVIPPSVPPARPMRSPAPRIIRQGAARSFGLGVAARQRIGLRQL